MSEQTPQSLGKYAIIEEIGRGGFAVVYKALDTALNRTVTLKVLAPHLHWDPTFIARFRQEAHVVASLKHPNMAIIHDIDEVEGRLYIAMEYLPGRPLSQIIEEQGASSLEDVISILRQVASALEYAHEQGLVHRDVKPSNIIVADDGHVTLTDFGLVKALESSGLTSKDKVAGTPEYMSPEQAESKPVDGRSDLYSLGIVAYEMLTGRVPFKGDSTPSTLYAQVHTPPPLLRDFVPDLPAEVERAINKMLAKTPDDRDQTAGELIAGLDAFAETLSETGPPEGKGPPPVETRERTRNWPLWAAAAAVFVILLALGLMFSWRFITPGPTEPTPGFTGARATETSAPIGTEVPAPTLAGMGVATSTPTRGPTATLAPRATPTDTPLSATLTLPPVEPTVYDDFNDPAYDGSYNTALWMPLSGDPKAHQESGVCLFPSTQGPDNCDRQLCPRHPREWYLEDFRYIEARLKLGADANGLESTVKIWLGSQISDRTWLAQCYLAGGDIRRYFHCDVYNPQFEFVTRDIGIAEDTWYMARIEIDLDATLRFYLDDELIASHRPDDADHLQGATFRPCFGVWHDSDSRATGYIDDVRIGQ